METIVDNLPKYRSRDIRFFDVEFYSFLKRIENGTKSVPKKVKQFSFEKIKLEDIDE
ncbi:hypothetical protein [Acinetobacter marinus]|uniref:hypothetical protein n=1 Tax=Acinetobacter marinus TaxID=281375 RepID=UPI00148A36C1|nr:hypothetical protein [Acinetobacter marinus]